MSDSIRTQSQDINSVRISHLAKAKLILEHAHETSASLLKTFDRDRRRRGGHKGGTTDEEQDILRSMLVLAAAGLDSMTKQVIRDCVTALAEKDEKVRQGVETFVARRIKSSEEGTTSQTAQFIAGILTSESPRKRILDEYINSLVGGSLQSPEELNRAVFALGLDPDSCKIKSDVCKKIFDIRNKIIHELDINFAEKHRRRRVRRRRDMIDHTNQLLCIGESILLCAWNKLK